MLDVNIFQGEMRKHLQNECFICDLERNVFEKVEGVRHNYLCFAHRQYSKFDSLF